MPKQSNEQNTTEFGLCRPSAAGHGATLGCGVYPQWESTRENPVFLWWVAVIRDTSGSGMGTTSFPLSAWDSSLAETCVALYMLTESLGVYEHNAHLNYLYVSIIWQYGQSYLA